jgi:corrinoid protein of di/trimethylamine methyltransferase
LSEDGHWKGEITMDVAILENLKNAVVTFDVGNGIASVRKALKAGIDPLTVAEALIKGVAQVGEGFGRGDLFLPELVGAAKVLEGAMPIVEQEIKQQGKRRNVLGSVVIGTVLGDIHTIGKDMVATLLTAEGFQVYDLGMNVSADHFVGAVRKHKPDVLALSALMTMTAHEQGKIIETLKREGLRNTIRIMVGGGAVTSDFAQTIGADGYESTAPRAAKLAKKLIGVE